MQDIKQNIKQKINDIDQMLNDLDLAETQVDSVGNNDDKLNINQLHVVEVLDKILS